MSRRRQKKRISAGVGEQILKRGGKDIWYQLAGLFRDGGRIERKKEWFARGSKRHPGYDPKYHRVGRPREKEAKSAGRQFPEYSKLAARNVASGKWLHA